MIATFNFLGIEGERAVLSNSDGQQVYWPKDKLPLDLSVGAALTFSILTPKDLVKNNQELAGEILNEILKISD